MGDIKWTIKGHEFINCNCAYGCPCQFNALPTHGFCEAVGGFQIDQGFHGDTKLDALRFVGMFEKLHPPMFLPIDFQVDVEGRKARLAVPGVTEGRGEPIVNPVTGREHRPRIDIVGGFEYEQAEIGRGWTKSTQPIRMELADTYGQFAHLHLSQSGIVH